MNFDASSILQQRAHALIPGGCHTYAKGDDQYPQLSPGFIAYGKGCHVWDVDNNEFIEYGMGLRAVSLGHAYEPVITAAYEQMKLGSNFTRPAPIEIQCAEQLVDLIDCADQVKFAKDGSTVVTAALKLARAATGRDMVAICADHPFFSYNDWFIGTTDIAGGIPDYLKHLTVKFSYNDIGSLERVFTQYPDRIAAVVTEAARTEEPADGFLQLVQALCRRKGAVFVLDEMITGFRWHLNGAQEVYNIEPDLACFGKALANGFSLSALVGRRDLMELGGIRTPQERVFLLSTTHGAETPAIGAAVKTLQIYQSEPVVETLYRQGRRLREGIEQVTTTLGMEDYVGVLGRDCNLVYFTHDQEGKPSQPLRTLLMQELIRQGILAPSFVVSYSHSNDDIDRTIEAVSQALVVYKRALEEGVDRFLVGESVKPVYRRYA